MAATMTINLNRVDQFIDEINKVKSYIKNNENYRNKIINQCGDYQKIKDYLIDFLSLLEYTVDINIKNFYRVRKIDDEKPFSSRKDLIYPEPNPKHNDRMNNTSFRVLYTSLHEFTAMAESRINESFIGKRFQLTRFSMEKQLKAYKLGFFSEKYLNSPRNSDKNEILMMGNSALECAIADILYDQDDGYHIFSSIVADAVFSTNEKIDVIAYPSMQNRYGINLAIKKSCADSLEISYSCMNLLNAVHKNGFFNYTTEMECYVFSDQENFVFNECKGRFF